MLKERSKRVNVRTDHLRALKVSVTAADLASKFIALAKKPAIGQLDLTATWIMLPGLETLITPQSPPPEAP